MARHGRQGLERLGAGGSGAVWLSKAGLAWRGVVGRGAVRPGLAWQARLVMAGLGSDRFGSARQAWHGTARRGLDGHGLAWLGRHG